MRRPAHVGDFASGLALAALGAWIVTQAHAWTYMGEDGPGPGFFPTWYGGIMVALSLVLVARSALAAAPREPRARTPWREVARAFTCWTAFVACIALMNWTGFAIAFALLAWFVVAFMARRPQRVALPVAIGGAALFHLVFVVLLEVRLPRGVFF